MKNKLLFGILFLWGCLYADTPTERFLQKHPFSSIQEDCVQSDKGGAFEKNTPLFLQIIENEKEAGFFGYHASSQSFRLFQDILRAVFEETLKISLPQDFYFFRIPGAPEYSKLEDIQNYLDLIAPKPPTLDEQKQLIELLVLRPLNKDFQLGLKIETFSQQELDVLFKPLLATRESIIQLWTDANTFNIDSPYSPFTQEIAQLFFKKGITQEMEVWLHQHLDTSLVPILYYDNCIDDPLNEKRAVSSFLYAYNDHRPGQQENVISLNIALFGNLMGEGESSLYIFLMGETIGNGETKGIDSLYLLFEEIGFPPSLVDQLYKIGTETLRSYGEGCFFQFFDHSSDQNHIHNYIYLSAPFGIPYTSLAPLDVLKGVTPLFTTRDIPYQIRLLITNHQTLNPYSSLRIKRYDSVPPQVSNEILERFKTELRKAPVNASQRDAYLKKIKTLWNYEN